MADLKRVSISIEEDLLEQFDRHIERRGYPTRSESIKALIRDSLVKEEWSGNQLVAGAVTMVYDHHRRGILEKLMHVQHDFGEVIISTQHVHLDHDNCLEIVVVKGQAGEIQSLVNALRSVKGVKHNSLVMTSAGQNLG